MDDWIQIATAETIAVLRQAGLEIRDWSILSQSNRVVLELKPCQLIAKVVPISAHRRLALEVAVAKHVVAHSGPSVRPGSKSGPFLSPMVAVSLWEPIEIMREPSEPAICRAYADLRDCLDSFTDALPDFLEQIEGANGLVRRADLPAMSLQDALFLQTLFERALKRLASFRWSAHALHGDPHSGNVVLTPHGPLWLDLESVCSGPLEWDLCALPDCARSAGHDRDLLAVLRTLRSACVVAWCAAKAPQSPADAEAVAYHLVRLKAEIDSEGSPTPVGGLP
jgi:hypothetical protein